MAVSPIAESLHPGSPSPAPPNPTTPFRVWEANTTSSSLKFRCGWCTVRLALFISFCASKPRNPSPPVVQRNLQPLCSIHLAHILRDRKVLEAYRMHPARDRDRPRRHYPHRVFVTRIFDEECGLIFVQLTSQLVRSVVEQWSFMGPRWSRSLCSDANTFRRGWLRMLRTWAVM